MKYVKFIYMVVILYVSSCEYNNKEDIKVGSTLDYTFNHDIKCETVECMMLWVADDNNVEYRYDTDISEHITDYFQLPHETYIMRKGDCEDFSLLLAQLLYELTPEKSIYLVGMPLTIDSGHVALYYDGDFYEPQTGLIMSEPKNISWLCPYDQAIWMAQNHHDFVGRYTYF